jgi:DNA polymerase family A
VLAVPDDLRELGVTDIVAVDAEYVVSRKGEHVSPVCICAKSLINGKEWSQFNDGTRQPCPFPVDPETLFVSYAAPAEWSYFLAMGWELPLSIIDLFAEMSLRLNGLKDEKGRRFYPSLLMAMDYYGLDALSAAEKHGMRELILRGDYSSQEKKEILDYCWSDVVALERLLPVMLPKMDAYGAMQRGAYTRVCAAVEFNGIPIDVPVYRDLKDKWPAIKAGLAMAVEERYDYGVFVRNKKGSVTWNEKGFQALVYRLGLQDVWPRTELGKLRTSDSDKGADEEKVFKTMAQQCPYFEPLRVARKTLTNIRKFDLPVGADGRLRYNPMPWASLSGRNQPRQGNIFGLPKWARRLIRPEPGAALAYIDLRACEFGIAAGLSQDPEMLESYVSSADVYLRLAHLAGAVPKSATRDSHPHERALYKVAQLAASYGQTPYGLAKSTGCSIQKARIVHENLRKVYQRYFRWIDHEAIKAEVRKRMESPLGWSVPVHAQTVPNFLFNFPIQSAGADILRAATTLMLDEGVRILALVHDAVLIEDSIQSIEQSVKVVQDCWRRAAASILNGLELDSDVEIVRYPETFAPKGTEEFWNLLTDLRRKANGEELSPCQ